MEITQTLRVAVLAAAMGVIFGSAVANAENAIKAPAAKTIGTPMIGAMAHSVG